MLFIFNPIENPEKIKPKNSESLITLITQLDELQKDKNDWKSVDCVKDVITYLKAGCFKKTKAICFHNHDKIVNYPDIK